MFLNCKNVCCQMFVVSVLVTCFIFSADCTYEYLETQIYVWIKQPQIAGRGWPSSFGGWASG
jgi:hypothetical protein